MNPQSDLACLLSPESRVPQHHPLRRVKALVDEVLCDLSDVCRDRPAIPPERLLKAKVLQALYPIRFEALLVEALDYNLLFRWFLALNLLDPRSQGPDRWRPRQPQRGFPRRAPEQRHA